MATLPSFTDLRKHYPVGTSDDAKKLIFGDKNQKTYITNTCVIRLSRALNYGGSPIPGNFTGLVTEKGIDKQRYALRVAEFRRYMKITYGTPTAVSGKAGALSGGSLSGSSGIICFDVPGWSDATGHVTLWDGATCLYGDYFSKAVEVLLWKC